MDRIGVIVNPSSRKNRRAAPGRADRIRRIVGDHGDVHVTDSVDEIRPALRALLRARTRWLVSDGGDGTLHWMLSEAREVLEEDEFRDTPLPAAVPTNGGTIDFVARKAGLRGDSEDILEALAGAVARGEPPATRRIDTLAVTGVRPTASGEEVPFERVGFAVAAGGVAQRFFARYYEHDDPTPGTIVGIVARAVGSLGARRVPGLRRYGAYADGLFAPTRARVCIDGVRLPGDAFRAINAGAIDTTLGGVFRIFPLAAEPGRLHFQVGALTPGEIVRAIPSLVRGGLVDSHNLVEVAGREMTVEAVGDDLLSPVVDGEPYTDVVRLTLRAGPPIDVPRLPVS